MNDSDNGDQDSFPQLPLPKAVRPTAAAPSQTEGETQKAPRQSDYEIVRTLGSGGMGVVHLAKHRVLGREVALKQLHQGLFAGPEQRSRFLQEAQIASRLRHDCIVRVFELGESEQGPFIAFEYIEGQTLADLINGTPQSPKKAAELVRQLADAMDHAHQTGVIHRDLKPANILMDNHQVPRITDFGLARLAGQNSGATRTGDIMGTPAYMAPEQASGAVHLLGPGTDVYSLGAILFELLTGTPPFRGTDPMAVVLAVLSTDPPPPRQLVRTLPRDLETICLKCLEKTPARRYLSARLLAEDLSRFLSNEPILARPASIPDRLIRWARRHPAVASLLSAGTISLASFVTYGIWKNQQLTAMLERSDTNFREALRASRRRIESTGQQAELVLEEELQFLNGIRTRSDTSQSTRYERAIAASLSGQILTRLGRYDEALSLLNEAGLTLNTLAETDSQWASWYQGELSSVYVTRARIEELQGQSQSAEESLKKGLEILDTLRQTDPDNMDVLRDQAAVWNNLAIMAGRRNDMDACLSHHRKSLAIKEQLLAKAPGNAEVQTDLLTSLTNLASALIRQNESTESGTILDRAEAELEKLPPLVRQLAASRMNKAVLHTTRAQWHRMLSNHQAAAEQFRQSVTLLSHLAQDYPEVAAYLRSAADAEVELGRDLMSSDAVQNSPEQLSDAARSVISEAAVVFESAVSRYRTLADRFPNEQACRQLADQLQPGIDQLRSALSQ